MRRVFAFALVLVGLFSVTTFAQTATTSLRGVVTDASGALVPNATVSLSDKANGTNYSATTNSAGRYIFPVITPATYQVDITSAGFAPQSRIAELLVNQPATIDFTMSVKSNNTTVNVSTATQTLNLTDATEGNAIGNTTIEALPMDGRNPVALLTLQPGVLYLGPENTDSRTGAVAGGRSDQGNVTVDGLDDNNQIQGTAFTGVLRSTLDSTEEFRVTTSNGTAEAGHSSGAQVNLVTKSGTNTLHGAAYGYLRNSSLNAANALSNTVLPLTQAQYGASLSGPLVHDKTFYFANFEGRDLNQSGFASITPANVALINARLISVGYPGPLISTGQYRNPIHNEDFFSKVDHRFNEKDQFSARYSLYHVESINSRGAGALSAPTASANLFDTDQTVAASNVWTISPRMVNETRGQFTNSNLAAPPSDPIGPAVSISGVASFGTLSGSPTARVNQLYEATDSLSIQHGAHAIRFGVDFLYNNDTITFPRTNRGSYSFSSLANFLSGTYNSSGFAQTFGVTQVHQTNPNVGFYAQDEYKIASNFTLNLGFRYDLEFLKSVATQTGNVSPRGGFAWTPFASRRTVVRGSYGLFYDRIPLRPLANALLSAGNTTVVSNLQQLSISLSPTQAGAPVFPNILGALTIPAGVLFNFSTMDPHMKNAYSEQGSLQIEQQISNTATVSVGYQHVRGLHLIISVNQNVPTCAAVGTNDGCRPNLTFGNDSQYSSLADSYYDAVDVAFIQRPVKWGSYRVSYTYSKALDNVSEFFFSAPLNNYNIWQDYGRSDDDQRSRLTFEGTIHSSLAKANTAWERLSHGFQFTTGLTAYSPLPFNITTGANTIQGTGARPTVNGAYINRNAGESYSIVNMNIRLSRSFAIGEKIRLQALGELFNTLNHTNVVSLNGVFGTGAYPSSPLPTFRQITAVNDPRTAQFGLRLSF